MIDDEDEMSENLLDKPDEEDDEETVEEWSDQRGRERERVVFYNIINNVN